MPVALLVEDDLQPRVETAALLRQLGLRARTVTSPAGLRRRVQEDVTNLLVISVEFDGDRAGDWLAELSRHPVWQNVPVIATTERPLSVFAAALRESSTPVLAKPITAKALRGALQQLGLPTRRGPLRRKLTRAHGRKARDHLRLALAIRRRRRLAHST